MRHWLWAEETAERGESTSCVSLQHWVVGPHPHEGTTAVWGKPCVGPQGVRAEEREHFVGLHDMQGGWGQPGQRGDACCQLGRLTVSSCSNKRGRCPATGPVGPRPTLEGRTQDRRCRRALETQLYWLPVFPSGVRSAQLAPMGLRDAVSQGLALPWRRPPLPGPWAPPAGRRRGGSAVVLEREWAAGAEAREATQAATCLECPLHASPGHRHTDTRPRGPFPASSPPVHSRQLFGDPVPACSSEPSTAHKERAAPRRHGAFICTLNLSNLGASNRCQGNGRSAHYPFIHILITPTRGDSKDKIFPSHSE